MRCTRAGCAIACRVARWPLGAAREADASADPATRLGDGFAPTRPATSTARAAAARRARPEAARQPRLPAAGCAARSRCAPASPPTAPPTFERARQADGGSRFAARGPVAARRLPWALGDRADAADRVREADRARPGAGEPRRRRRSARVPHRRDQRRQGRARGAIATFLHRASRASARRRAPSAALVELGGAARCTDRRRSHRARAAA